MGSKMKTRKIIAGAYIGFLLEILKWVILLFVVPQEVAFLLLLHCCGHPQNF